MRGYPVDNDTMEAEVIQHSIFRVYCQLTDSKQDLLVSARLTPAQLEPHRATPSHIKPWKSPSQITRQTGSHETQRPNQDPSKAIQPAYETHPKRQHAAQRPQTNPL